MTKTHTETNATAIRNLDPAELDCVSGGEITKLYDVTVAGIHYEAWMNPKNGDWIIDVSVNGGKGIITSKGGFYPG